MLRIIAILFGIGFIFAGVAGFLPTFTYNDYLFGYLMVGPLHNIVHIVTGVIAIMAATTLRYTQLFFKIFGIIYFLVAIIGFYRQGDLFIMQVNFADNVFHLIIGLLAIYLGFWGKRFA